MEIEIVRTTFTANSTIGKLFIDGKFECYTLEDVKRPAGVKIKGETCIPDGRYQVIVNFSSRFKRLMPLLLNVPMFTGIRIHNGNTKSDTLGCILVGQSAGIDRVFKSVDAYNALFPKIDKAVRNEKVWITVRSEAAVIDNGGLKGGDPIV